MIEIRQAVEGDLEAIRDIFLASYERDYAYPQYYDINLLRKLIFADDTVLLVAEETETGKILGTASVLLEVGAHADLVGEFGRLVVHPDARRRGVGHRLMEDRIARVRERLHLGLVEPRLAHSFSQRISFSHGFAPFGVLPLKLLLTQRESVAVAGQFFGDALRLRRNHPRILPEIYPLAELVLTGCGIETRPVVEDDPAPYPHDDRFALEELTTQGYSTLLHFQRGRVQRREIFGRMRLHYGLFRLQAEHSNYLIVRRKGQIVGGVGFSLDAVERVCRIFEVVALDEGPIRFLLATVKRNCQEKWDIEYLETDVSAYAPRMQRTLLEMGFLPAAYIPAMVFHQVERLDTVRMACLLVPPDFGQPDIVPELEHVAKCVLDGFEMHYVVPKVAEAVPSISAFAGLTDEQVQKLAAACTVETFGPEDFVFRQHDEDGKTHLVLSGRIAVAVGDEECQVGEVGPGECLGEISLVAPGPHSATARATEPTETAVLTRAALQRLVHQRPDIGTVVYRNLAVGLGEKLLRSDARLARRDGESPRSRDY